MASTVAPGCPVHSEFDPLAPHHLDDPFAVMRALPLSDAPVFYAPSIGYYVITRYEDIEAIFLDHETFSAAAAQLPLAALSPQATELLLGGGHRPAPSMVSLDQPEHTRVRRHTARAFTPRRVASMEGTIRTTVNDLLDAVDPADPFDLVASLTFPLPATIVFTLIGVPPEDYGQLKRWCGYRAGLTFGSTPPEEQVAHAENIVAYRRYLRGLVDERVERRTADLTSALIDIHDEDPEALTLDEIASICFSLSFAGHETTNYLIGNVMRRLLEDRARWERIVADPEAIPGAVEETLRFDPSVCVWRRVTTRPTTVGGVDLPAGAKLFLWLAAAGRDPSVFPEPNAFDVDRENARRHLAFGRGIHFCLGPALGKLEAELAVEELARRWPELALVDGQELTFSPNISFRGPQALWVVASR
ncbi:MAG TPA: cytochrome P450 [Solirubrobacteraceae bacterium]|nr:cytochrome P450 [Solirubrobacteraceae bacterium]